MTDVAVEYVLPPDRWMGEVLRVETTDGRMYYRVCTGDEPEVMTVTDGAPAGWSAEPPVRTESL